MEDKLKKIIAYVLVIAITFGTFSGMGPLEVSAAEVLTTEIAEEDVTDEIISESETETTTEVIQDTETDDLEVPAEETMTVGIEIESEPIKTVYTSGEELDLTGLVVNAVNNDDSRVALESVDYQVSGFDSSVMGEQTITVTYGEYSATFTINVWVAHGTCGDNLTWTLDERGELRISGTGDMTNWGGVPAVPWYSYRGQIKTLVLEEGITNIGRYAFCGCSEITGSLILPDSVTTIGTCAFDGCTGFSGNLVIPESATTISGNAFSDCTGFEGTLVLPDAVTTIGNYAFYKCNQLTGIVFGENVSSIKESAFANCSGVQEMIFKGTDVPYAGENAFAGMTALCKVKIPQSEMFLYSVNLGGHFSEQVAYIPITEEGEELELVGIKVSREIYKKNYLLRTDLDKTGLIIYAMYSDGSEEAVKNYTLNGFDSETVGEKEITVVHAGYTTSFTVNVFENLSGICGESLTWTLNYDGTLTISGTGAMTEYASDSEIPWSSEKTNIKTLILSDELTTISAYAFNGCTNLTGTITIPKSVTSIGNNAFTDCSNIIEVVFESEIVPTFGTNVFSSTMTALETIYVPVAAYDSYVGALSGMVSDTAEFVAVEEAVVTGIEIESEPTKKGYISGEELDLTGLVIKAVYSDDSKVVLETVDYQVSEFDSTVTGEQIITVTYGEYTATFTVNVWVAHGTCGENLIWTLDEAGELRISGTGDMTNWTYTSGVPWYSYKEQIKTLVLEEGITSVGGYAFYNYSGFNGELKLPETLTTIGIYAFYNCSGFEGEIKLPETLTIIAGYAFYNCSGFNGELKLPEALTTIGIYAFYKCSGFSGKLEIPAGIKIISDNAFYNCTGLTSMKFPNSITKVGYNSFYGCNKIETITFEGSTPAFGGYAFYGTNALKKIYVPATALDGYISNLLGKYGVANTVEIIPVSDTGEELTVVSVEITTEPTKKEYLYGESLRLDGIKGIATYNDGSTAEVTSFTASGYNALVSGEQEITVTFRGCTDTYKIKVLVSGNLTDTLTWNIDEVNGILTISGTGDMPEYTEASSVPWYYGRTNIKSLVLEDSITSISAYSFYQMSNLSGEIKIPYGVTSIGTLAFYNCSSLTGIELPETVTTIGRQVFQGCSKLVSANLPEKLNSIPNSMFYGCYTLESIEIPESIINIEDFAFYDCDGLISVIIPENATSIGSSAFYSCSNMTSVEIPNSLISIGSSAFAYCWKLTNIELPENITSIASSLFRNCSVLTSINIPESVTSIGSTAFENCDGLTEISIPDSVISIGDSAFYDCDGLVSVKIPENVTSIGSKIFWDCGSLTSVEIPNSVTGIGEYAFRNCDALVSIKIPENVTSIGNYAFFDCDGLTSLEIPDSVQTIGHNAFNGCNGITRIDLGKGVTRLGARNYSSPFYGMTGVTKVIFRSTAVPTIYNNPFASMTKLKAICVPEESMDLYKAAFSSYVANGVSYVALNSESVIEYIEIETIPEKTTYLINEELDTTGLVVNAVYSDGSKAEVTDYTVNYDTSSDGNKAVIITYGEYGENMVTFNIRVLPSGTCGETLYWKIEEDGTLVIYGTGAMTSYSSAYYYPWQKYSANIKSIALEEGVTSIAQYAFHSYYSNMKGNLEIPETVTSIGQYAFSSCKGLTGSLNIPDSVITLGAYAFTNCSGFDGKLTLSSNLTRIGKSTFYNCSGFSGALVIPDNIVSIDEHAFYGCSGLDETLTLSPKTTDIENYAFYGCNNITGELVIPNTLTGIGEWAFANCYKISSIILPSSIGILYNGAFANCTGVTEMTFERTSVPTVYTNTFGSMTSLQMVKVPQAAVSKYASSYGSRFSAQAAFIPITEEGEKLELTGIKIVTEPSKKDYLQGTELITTGLKVNAVYSDESEVTITNYTVSGFDSGTAGEKVITVMHAGQTAIFKVNVFENLSEACGDELTWVLDADGTLTISGTGEMYDYSNTSYAPWYIDREVIKTIIIEDGVTDIGNYAFYDCDTLSQVEIPDSVKEIGQMAFLSCAVLEEVELPESLTKIEYALFSGCSKILNVNIPVGVKSIENRAFSGCNVLENIELPEGLTSIGQDAFYNCYTLNEIVFPESLTSIGSYAFYNCDGLTEIVLPDSVTSIETLAFYACDNLVSATISGSVESFGTGMFNYCSRLKTVEIKEGITELPNSTFYQCNSLTDVILPETLKTIGNSAFKYCSGLENIDIPTGVTAIGDYAFERCTKLSKLELPETVRGIGRNAFGWCHALTGELNIPSSVQRIGEYAFYSCNEITGIKFNRTVRPTFSGNYIFNNMTALESFKVPKATFDSYVGAIKNNSTIADTVAFIPITESGEELEVSAIELTAPTKKDYIAGFDLDLTGMQVYALFSDDTKQEVKNYTVSTFDKVRVGDQTLTVSYVGKETTFDVTVHEAATPSQIVNVTALSDSTGIYLTWSMAAEATTDIYRIYRKAEGEEAFTLVTEVEGRETLSYKDTAVEEGVVYAYYVTGKNAAELEGQASATVSEALVVDDEAPVVTKLSPENGSYLVGTKTISMTAQDNVGVAQAELYYSLDEGENWVLIGEGTSEELKISFDSTQLPDGEIRMKGVAYDAKGNESTALTYAYYVDNTGPEQVQGLAYESTSITITLSWDDVADDDISYYAVEKKQLDGSYTRVATVSKTLGVNLSGLTPDTKYVYRVAGYDLRGNRGVVSETITAMTQPDTTLPVITQIRPVSGYYVDALNMTFKAEDEYNVASLIVQISKDTVTWTDVETKVYTNISKTRNFEYVCPLDEYEEGTIYVRAIAIDSAGNESASGEEAPFVQYMIDRTAPEVPESVKAQGGDGYIEISWIQGSESDLGTYSVYRAESTDGAYTKIADGITAINHFDTNVEEGITYHYKVSVNDKAGNESGYSEVVSANAIPDEEKPEIISIYPEAGSSLGPGYCTISVLATDNQLIEKLVFEYSNNAVSYTEMTVKEEINASSAKVTAKVPIEEFVHGDNLYIRVTAYDKAGNVSERVGQQYVVDAVAPLVSSVKTEFTEDHVHVSWIGEPSSDLIGYKVYKKSGANGSYSLIAQKQVVEGQTEYFWNDYDLQLEKVTYYYKVEAIDSCGNTSMMEANALELEDRTIPTAVISCESTMEKGVEYIIDASDSKDNSVIMAYHFDFGDGATSTDKQAVHKYEETGEYTITLTVTDDEGNTSVETKVVVVKEREMIGTVKIRVVDEDGNAVASAPVYFDLGEDTQVIKNTDSKGYASFTADVGKHTIGCIIANNEWLPAKKEIVVTAGAETVVELTMLHYTMIEGQFEVKRMTFEEIKAAGIDVSKPENQYFVQVDVTLNYGAEKLLDTTIHYNETTGEVISPPTLIETPDGEKHQIIPGVIIPEVDDDTDITDTISVAYLEVPVGVSAVKDFFNVNLHIINNASEEFSMKDNLIALNLPEGLTLMETEATAGETNVPIDEIKGQTTETITWLVRGDQAGEYYLSADYSGTLSEFNKTVYTSFVSTEPIKIYGMSEMNFIVEVAEELDEGKGYYNMILQNNGTEDAYLPEITTEDVLLKTELLDENGTNILGENHGKPEILAGGYSFVNRYVSDVEVEDGEWDYELQEYMLSMKNTYGLEAEMVTKPLSHFVEVEKEPLTIITQPEDQVVKAGETAVFTVEAEGTELNYQWQYSKNGTYWYNSGMEGSMTPSLVVEGLAKRNGQQYRCVITDVDGEEVITEAVTLTVQTEKNLTVVKQPADQSVTEGETAEFTLLAEGTELKYQWQYSTDGVYWHNSGMEGSATASLKVPALKKRNGQQYRCVVMDGNGNEVITEAAVLTVQVKAVIVITSQPTAQIAEVGENAVFTVVVQGEDLKYQWQYSTGGTYWFNSGMEGADTASLTVPVLAKRNGQQYRCVVTDGSGNELTSEAAVLTVKSCLQILEQPENQTVLLGETAIFKATAQGENLKYQWQYSNNGGKYWYDSGMSGSDADTLYVAATAKRNGQQYRCVITDAEGSNVTSEAATLNVN